MSSPEIARAAEGYVLTPYTCHHHPGLDPLRARWLALRHGFEPRPIERACELGFGQGLSLAIHATASEIEWWGTELNPSHVELTHSLVTDAAARKRLVAASFTEFFARDDLPQFDFIALHGVWSWISAANRKAIIEFIDRQLAADGLMYLSYNAMPGWSSALSLRELLVAHATSPRGAALPLDERIERALEYAVSVAAADPLWLHALPQAERHLRDIRHRNSAYLAHEYFNRDWRPWHYAEVAAMLQPIGLDYVGQSDCSDGYDEWRFSPAQLALLAGCDDLSLRETTRDLLLDRRFRRDIWCRPTSRNNNAKYQALRIRDVAALQQVPLWHHEQSVTTSVEWPAAVMSLREKLSVAGGVAFPGVLLESADDERALSWLWRAGEISVQQEQRAQQLCAAAVRELNARLLTLALDRGDISALASSLSGTGVELDWIELALLKSALDGQNATETLLQVASRARALGVAIRDESGEILTGDEEQLTRLQRRWWQLVERRDRYQQIFALPLDELPALR